jgi:hypothetical protein
VLCYNNASVLGLLAVGEEYLFKKSAQESEIWWTGFLCLLHGAVIFLLLMQVPVIMSQWPLQLCCMAVIISIEDAAIRATLSKDAYKVSKEGLEVYRRSDPLSSQIGASTNAHAAGELFWLLVFFPFCLIVGGDKTTLIIPWGAITSVTPVKEPLGKAIQVEFNQKILAEEVWQESAILPLVAKHDLRMAVMHLAPESHPFRDFVENGGIN